VWLLGAIEQEVDLSDGVDRAGRPDPRVTTRQRGRTLTRQSADKLAGRTRVFAVEMLGACLVGDREDLAGTAA